MKSKNRTDIRTLRSKGICVVMADSVSLKPDIKTKSFKKIVKKFLGGEKQTEKLPLSDFMRFCRKNKLRFTQKSFLKYQIPKKLKTTQEGTIMNDPKSEV